jgi:hypothetical protein
MSQSKLDQVQRVDILPIAFKGQDLVFPCGGHNTEKILEIPLWMIPELDREFVLPKIVGESLHPIQVQPKL